MIYRAANEEVAAGAAAGSSSTASLAVAESAVSAALYATAGAAGAAMAADAVMEAVKTAASAKSASRDSKDDNDGSSSSTSESTTKKPPLSPSPAAVRHFNRHNVVMKSFRNVALADLELVFPSKHVEVLPSTLVRSALTAVGAVVAAAALIQQQVGM